MTPSRFAALADAFGGNIDRWPEGERQEGWAYFQSAPDGRLLLEAQARLDGILASWTVQPPETGLLTRIAADVVRRQATWRRVRLWLSGVGAAAAVAGGVAAGTVVVSLSALPSEQDSDRLYGIHVLGMPFAPAQPRRAPESG